MSRRKIRKQEILNQALDLFIEKGYHKTRTSEIAEKTGIAAGTLFNYFEKKEQILNDLYVQIKKEVMSLMDSQSNPDEHVFTFLKRNWMKFTLWGVDNYKKILFLQQMEDSPIVSSKIKKKMESSFTSYVAIYQRAITQGILKDLPLELGMVWFYQAMLSTINYIVKFKPKATKSQKSEIAEMSFNNYLYGVRI